MDPRARRALTQLCNLALGMAALIDRAGVGEGPVGFARRWPRRRRGVSELLDQTVDGRLIALDCGTFVVGKRDLDQHPLEPSLASSSCDWLDSLGR